MNALLGMANNFIQSAAEGVGSRYRSFPKDDRMYYFIRHIVIVFNTNLKKTKL